MGIRGAVMNLFCFFLAVSYPTCVVAFFEDNFLQTISEQFQSLRGPLLLESTPIHLLLFRASDAGWVRDAICYTFSACCDQLLEHLEHLLHHSC